MTQRITELYVEFSNGRVFVIPASLIAGDRAQYYANVDVKETGGGEWLRVYDREVAYALSDQSELFDWAENNMNWEDVKGQAQLVQHNSDPDMFDKEWSNAVKWVEK
jgi:hypothetical protein